MKKLMLLPLLLLVACSPKPTSVVDRYLKAVQAGNTVEQDKMMCVSGTGTTKSLIQSAPSWTIVGEESRTIDSFHYQVVTVKIGENTFFVRVWKSDDIYKQHKDSTDDLRQHGIAYEDPAYDRSQWSAEESCVSVERKP